MTILTNTAAAVAGIGIAAGVVFGPDIIAPKAIVVECSTLTMTQQSDDGIVTVFGDCKTGTATAVEVVVPAIPGDNQI
jgi:hypothetical protein